MKKKARGKQFPMPVTRGSVTILINRIRKKTRYIYYQVRYYADGLRKTKFFSDLGKAGRAAAAIARKLHKGGSRVVQLRGSDCTAYLQAKVTLSPIQVRLELAAHEYRLCHDLLAGRASMVEPVRYFAEAKADPVTPKAVPVILKELLEVRKKEGASDVHVKDLGGPNRWSAGDGRGPSFAD